MNKLIINAALTGMVPTRADNPALPVTPREIAADAKRCYDAGASIVHLHARDDQGCPTWLAEIYADIVERVRTAAPDVIVCVSTSGRLWGELEKRSAVLNVPGIEMASLTMGSMNFPLHASVNDPPTIKALAGRMVEVGVMPELEIFELGMLSYAHYLVSQKIIKPPHYCNLFLGSLGTIAAVPHNLAAMIATLPPGTTWAATGVGRYQFEVNCWAVAMGGHVRVGLEDGIWMDAGKTDPATNARQVERIAKVARAMGREVAGPDEARGMIWNRCLS